jgi:hypothetical protein
VIEASRPSNPYLAGIAGLYILARIAHGVGMDGGPFRFGRMIGTMITMITLLGLAVWAGTIALDM